MEDNILTSIAKIKVLGVGGAGNNSIRSLINSVNVEGVSFIAINTDKQALKNIANDELILQIGNEHGRGAGAKPEIGKESALTSEQEIKKRISNTELVIIAAGMGGGTGTGASPEIARMAKEQGALTLAVITTPFEFEGHKRMRVAKQGLEELKKHVDGYIIVSNEKLINAFGELPLNDSWKYSNKTLKQLIRSIIDITTMPSAINLDFADLQSLILNNPGEIVVGIGKASGTDKAQVAVTNALKSPVLETNIIGAKECMVHVAIGSNGTLNDIKTVANTVKEIIGQDVEIMFGYHQIADKNKESADSLTVTIIAAGINSDVPKSTQQIHEEVNAKILNSNIQFESESTREISLNASNANDYIANNFADTNDFTNENLLEDVFG
ncbi:cell division protein FtsZ [Mycoplasma phocoenae]|uniref:Cell division protein FtsZ n=1 Tax=Mycoplasma phocoenae TaxID=754517 RepID=A0A858U6N6_9MOLU|nr:cell division protein FtsZ [Mycoplasma phocoenae]QJG67117.1 cell division protein FtsZ [Mycoplasma phocoenae]